MENRSYEIKRNNVFVGELGMFNVNESFIGKSIRCYSPYNGQLFGYTNDYYRLKDGDFFVHNFHPLRSILFCLTEEQLSNDLLYNSPNYPILNVTNIQLIEKYYDIVNSIIIRYARNLSSLLSFYDFPEFLNYKDIKRIMKMFFTGNFVRNNMDLFGGNIVEEGCLSHYEDPIPEYPSVLPFELRFVLDYLGNNAEKSFLTGKYAYGTKLKEEHVRKLYKI